MQKKWQIREGNPVLQRKLSETLDLDPVIAQLLINRDIYEIPKAQQFFAADSSQLFDPFKMKNMDRAVERIRHAQQKEEKVLIFGDYDVDGVTSSVILSKLLRGLGVQVIHHIPHRMTDGYGLNHGIAEEASKQGVKLLIAVDCGTTANSEIDTLNAEGIDVIVMDHHEPPEGDLPNAYALINPKQPGCTYPFDDLASVGLAVKLVQAFHGTKGIDDEILALAALGTIADIAPLRSENRILAKAGLARISKTKNKGILALIEVAKIKDKKLSPFHVGFVLGPRINAAGRMDTAHLALDLLLTDDSEKARQLAKTLDAHNKDRQKTQKDITDEAMALVEQEINFSQEKIIVLNREGWHKGVLGIVAARLKEKYYRPSIVISTAQGEETATASARSIEGFHIQEALEQCSEYLENFGGHEGAAGLTIRLDKIDPFRLLINEVAEKMLKVEHLTPTIYVDCEIPLSSVTMKLMEMIERMEPFGEGNPAPVFCSRHVMVKSHPQVLGKDTLKFWVTDENAAVSAVGFGMADAKPLVKQGHPIDLVYQLGIDDWNKTPVVQLRLRDIKESRIT